MSPRQRNTDAVWVDVIPSMVGFGSELAKEAAGAGTRAGTAVAVELEKVAEQAGRDAGQRLGSGIAAAQARVDQFGAALRNARNKEEDAAGKVRVAEEKLNEVRALGEKASGSRIAAAEENLAKARRAAAAGAPTAPRDTTDPAGAGKAAAGGPAPAAATTATGATKDLERAEKDAAEATDDVVESTAEGGRGLGDYAGQLGGAAKAAAGFAIAAAGVGSAVDLVGQAISNTDVTAVLSAQLGATPQMAAEFGQIAGDLYARNYGESLQGVAEGLRAVHQSGALAEDATNEQLERITGRALNLQKTFNVDVAGAMRSVGVLMRNDMAPDAEFALDLITRGFQQGINVSDDFLETINEYSIQFRKLGLDGQTSFGLLSQGIKAGARDTDVVADSLKEFSIRALDGSAATIRGFESLGLNATKMAAQIGRGGADASAGLQTVLDKLRAMTDPVEQSRAAVDLFGTKAEDLGAALFALDPANAAGALGTVAGAAEKVGDTLAGSASANLQTFGRELQTWGVDLLGGKVIPILMSTVGWLRDSFGPALMASAQWIQQNREWLIPLVLVLGTFAVTYKAVAIAMDLWAKRTAIMTAAQWALNAAQAANPVGLIIAAIVALVVGFVYLWNTSAGFRNFWIGLWETIQAAALWVWDSVLKPTWAAIVAALQWVGETAMALWTVYLRPAFAAIGMATLAVWSVLSTVFDAIWTGLKYLGAIVFTLFVLPYVLAFKVVSAIATWLWETVLRPVLSAIGEFFGWLWTTWISPVVDFIVAKAQLLGAAFTLLWSQYVQPALAAIGSFFSWLWSAVISVVVDLIVGYIQLWATVVTWLWQSVVMPVFNAISVAISAVGAAFSWAWTNLIKPAWDALGSAISWVWDTVISPVFDAIKGGVRLVGEAFDKAVGFISEVWNKIKGVASTPVNFVIETVYNQGIKAVWDKVAGFVGLKELPRANPVTFAGGGYAAGYAPGVDDVPALLSRGESVLVPELTRAIGPRNIMAANYAASGRPGTIAGGGGVAHFAGGGVVGDLLGWVPGIGDDLKALWSDPRGWISSRIGSQSGFVDMIASVPAKLISSAADWLWSKLKSKFSFSSDAAAAAAGAAGGTPYGWQQMWEIIRTQFPTASLNSAFRPGDPGYHGKGRAVDLGGPMGAINSWIAKVYPNSTQLIYTPGVNLLNGRPFTYDGPTQADHHDHVHWAFDQGGYLPTGHSMVFNGTGKPERVLTDDQWEQIGGRGDGEGLSLVGAVVEVRDDGLLEFVDGRIERANQNTGSALARRTR